MDVAPISISYLYYWEDGAYRGLFYILMTSIVVFSYLLGQAMDNPLILTTGAALGGVAATGAYKENSEIGLKHYAFAIIAFLPLMYFSWSVWLLIPLGLTLLSSLLLFKKIKIIILTFEVAMFITTYTIIINQWLNN